MSCDHAEELTAASAGEPLTTALAAHVAGCESCRAELAELRAALALADDALRPLASAEPSPALRARIREQAASAAARTSAWWLRPDLGWTAAAAVLVLVTAVAVAVTGWRLLSGSEPPREVASSTSATPSPQNPAPPTASAAPPAPTDRLTSSAPTTAAGPSASRRREAAVAGTAARRAEPEVLVPPDAEQALLHYIALVHQQDVAPSALLAAGEPSGDLEGPSDILIEPLEILPLDPAETQGTQ